MSNAAEFIGAREAALGRLKALATADSRVAACWLQGSLADGSADALSDIDAYLAIRDDDFDGVFAERRSVVEHVGPVLFLADGLIPGLQAVNAVLRGPVKLDLIFERLSRSPELQRPATLMLVDKVQLEPQLQTGWEPPLDAVVTAVRNIFSGVRQGSVWPIRLLLREQWATYATVELRLINEYLAAMMAVQVYPRLLFKNPFTMTRLLRPAQRAELEALSLAVMEGVTRRDLVALQETHLRIADAFIREAKAAFATLELPYPGTEAGDAGLREMYERQWPSAVPSG